jgi:hypothetical protein
MTATQAAALSRCPPSSAKPRPYADDPTIASTSP